MSYKEGERIFVRGLHWETTKRELVVSFSRFGKVLDLYNMVERDTGRSRGFGFVTFAYIRAMEDVIRKMHNKGLNCRQISVNKAKPNVGSDDSGYSYSRGGYSSSGANGVKFSSRSRTDRGEKGNYRTNLMVAKNKRKIRVVFTDEDHELLEMLKKQITVGNVTDDASTLSSSKKNIDSYVHSAKDTHDTHALIFISTTRSPWCISTCDRCR
ncbi:glycine-rich RNA-binding protein GRP1A-like [Phalaenopsis equestris]|uniref:glycine-rich RNA-binding protein GRP1A-like n=1 Tax=Phalaenopsis equestris TaxID=78828 RepID=UPI0009E3C397|nr:glycine-rich RNA-binding protein GRP1A-like [Phalaenopsis equestris]